MTEELKDQDVTPEDDVKTEDDEQKPLEPWMQTENDNEDVPVNTHIRMKQKLKGRLSEKDDEISKLRQEIEALKKPQQPIVSQSVERPNRDDFDDDSEFDAAMSRYEDKRIEERFNRIEMQKKQDLQQQQFTVNVKQSVDAHYDRAAKLVDESGISPEVYQNADRTVRASIDALMPGAGDHIADQLISNLGEGSEKVMYYLGNNRAALAEFESLLAKDKSGLQAAIYLGKQQQRLISPTRKESNAPAPTREINGDEPISVAAGDLKKKYNAAHKKGDAQTAFKAKRAAKKAGVDTSGW